MTSIPARTSTTPGASGPLVALCAGHRCEALHRLADDQTGADRVRTTIASGRGAVLVSAPCLGACADGAIAAVARRDGATGTTGPSVWLSGVDRPAILTALLSWIRTGGPVHGETPATDVPYALQEAILGIGQPIQASISSRNPG